MANYMIKLENLRYKCAFCGELFKKCSECAEHIEKESATGICFPSDILMVDISDVPQTFTVSS